MSAELEQLNFRMCLTTTINSQELVDIMSEEMVDEDVADFIKYVSSQIGDKDILLQLRDFFVDLVLEDEGDE